MQHLKVIKLKTRVTRSLLVPVVLLIFLISSSTLNGQLTVNNNTQCTVYVQAALYPNTGCVWCWTSPVTALAPSGTVVFQDQGCATTEHWVGVQFTVGNPSGFPQGSCPNPVFKNGCPNGTNFGANCFLSGTVSGSFVGAGGTGAQTVNIQ